MSTSLTPSRSSSTTTATNNKKWESHYKNFLAKLIPTKRSSTPTISPPTPTDSIPSSTVSPSPSSASVSTLPSRNNSTNNLSSSIHHQLDITANNGYNVGGETSISASASGSSIDKWGEDYVPGPPGPLHFHNHSNDDDDEEEDYVPGPPPPPSRIPSNISSTNSTSMGTSTNSMNFFNILGRNSFARSSSNNLKESNYSNRDEDDLDSSRHTNKHSSSYKSDTSANTLASTNNTPTPTPSSYIDNFGNFLVKRLKSSGSSSNINKELVDDEQKEVKPQRFALQSCKKSVDAPLPTSAPSASAIGNGVKVKKSGMSSLFDSVDKEDLSLSGGGGEIDMAAPRGGNESPSSRGKDKEGGVRGGRLFAGMFGSGSGSSGSKKKELLQNDNLVSDATIHKSSNNNNNDNNRSIVNAADDNLHAFEFQKLKINTERVPPHLNEDLVEIEIVPSPPSPTKSKSRSRHKNKEVDDDPFGNLTSNSLPSVPNSPTTSTHSSGSIVMARNWSNTSLDNMPIIQGLHNTIMKKLSPKKHRNSTTSSRKSNYTKSEQDKLLRISFTAFHNSNQSGVDSASAFLGDELSVHASRLYYSTVGVSSGGGNINSNINSNSSGSSSSSSSPPTSNNNNNVQTNNNNQQSSTPSTPSTSLPYSSSFNSSLQSVDELKVFIPPLQTLSTAASASSSESSSESKSKSQQMSISTPLLLKLQDTENWDEEGSKPEYIIPTVIARGGARGEEELMTTLFGGGSGDGDNGSGSGSGSGSESGRFKDVYSLDDTRGGSNYSVPSSLDSSPSSPPRMNRSTNNKERSKGKSKSKSLPSHFTPIALGMVFISQPNASTSPSKGSAADMHARYLVLQQNYVFEYDNPNIQTSIPLGFMHLECSELKKLTLQSFELKCLCRPDVMSEYHGVVVHVSSGELCDYYMKEITRAKDLRIDDFYEFVDTSPLGVGRFAEVKTGKRKYANNSSSDDDDDYDEDERCAVKVISKAEFWSRVGNGMERQDTLVRELLVQGTLTSHLQGTHSSPVFVRLRGIVETIDHLAIEMELMRGSDLFRLLRQGSLTETEAVEIVHNLITAIKHMQTLGIGHRDLKLANIFLVNSFESNSKVKVKLGDYGMSNFIESDGLLRGRCGTPGYVAPEILRAGVNVGYKNNVDMFSVGVVMYTLLCGYEPFYGENDRQLVESNKLAKVVFHKGDWAGVSLEANDLILRMLEVDPAERITVQEAAGHEWFKIHGVVEENDVSVRSEIERVAFKDYESPTCNIL